MIFTDDIFDLPKYRSAAIFWVVKIELTNYYYLKLSIASIDASMFILSYIYLQSHEYYSASWSYCTVTCILIILELPVDSNCLLARARKVITAEKAAVMEHRGWNHLSCFIIEKPPFLCPQDRLKANLIIISGACCTVLLASTSKQASKHDASLPFRCSKTDVAFVRLLLWIQYLYEMTNSMSAFWTSSA